MYKFKQLKKLDVHYYIILQNMAQTVAYISMHGNYTTSTVKCKTCNCKNENTYLAGHITRSSLLLQDLMSHNNEGECKSTAKEENHHPQQLPLILH